MRVLDNKVCVVVVVVVVDVFVARCMLFCQYFDNLKGSMLKFHLSAGNDQVHLKQITSQIVFFGCVLNGISGITRGHEDVVHLSSY